MHRAFSHPLPAIVTVEVADGVDSCLPARPASMPLWPLEENIPQLELWLLRQFSSTTFNAEQYPLLVMEGPPHHIHLLEGVQPYICHTPASVPKNWEAEVKQHLDDDVKKGVIRSVPIGEDTEWCACMVVVAKKLGKPRRTVDFQKLIACCLWETHHILTLFEVVPDIPLHL